MKILFSPIGSTDPIRNMHDGSMLHITRHLRPDEVYLYFSHEMHAREKKDRRYTYCLDMLSKHLGKTIAVHPIVRDDLIDVQDYEIFYEDFKRILEDIFARTAEGDEVYVNISSGTPAMKNALLILSVLGDLPIHPIQVVTPIHRSNYTDENVDDYNAEEQWENNYDNTPDTQDRSEEIHPRNLTSLVKVAIIKKHLDAYDYSAAYEVSRQMGSQMPEPCRLAIEQAYERMNRNQVTVSQIAKKTGYQPMPVTKTEECASMEYLLALQLKVKRGNYDDFLRGLSPIIVDLFDRILRAFGGFKYTDYCDQDKDGNVKWSMTKLEQTPYLTTLQNADTSRYGFSYGFVYSRQLKELILAFCTNDKLKKLADDLRMVEETVRNQAAHTMLPFTDALIQRWTKFTVGDIMEKLKKTAELVKLAPNPQVWNSYDDMNEYIKDLLNKYFVFN